MKMKKVLENQGLFLAEKERFELSRRYSRPTPLAGAPLRPLEYFSVYSPQSAGCIGSATPLLYTLFSSLSIPFFIFLQKSRSDAPTITPSVFGFAPHARPFRLFHLSYHSRLWNFWGRDPKNWREQFFRPLRSDKFNLLCSEQRTAPHIKNQKSRVLVSRV